MNVKLSAAAVAFALAVGLSPAQANIIQVTYDGMVSYSNDQTNIFGGAPLGSLYHAVFLYDMSAASSTSISPTAAQVSGGSAFSPPSPGFSLGGTVTINVGGTNYTQTIPGTFYADILNNDTGGFVSQFHRVEYISGDPMLGPYVSNSLIGNISGPSGMMPVDPNQPFSEGNIPGFSGSSQIWLTTQVKDDSGNWIYSVNTNVQANITNFSVQDVNPVGAPGPTPGEGLLSVGLIVLMGIAGKLRSFVV